MVKITKYLQTGKQLSNHNIMFPVCTGVTDSWGWVPFELLRYENQHSTSNFCTDAETRRSRLHPCPFVRWFCLPVGRFVGRITQKHYRTDFRETWMEECVPAQNRHCEHLVQIQQHVLSFIYIAGQAFLNTLSSFLSE